jgi:hypothetical protein
MDGLAGTLGDITWPLALVVVAYRVASAWERISVPVSPEIAAPDGVVVPEDLVAVALTESEPWAQEEMLKAMREKYELYGDWNRVRSAFGVGAWAGDTI